MTFFNDMIYKTKYSNVNILCMCGANPRFIWCIKNMASIKNTCKVVNPGHTEVHVVIVIILP